MASSEMVPISNFEGTKYQRLEERMAYLRDTEKISLNEDRKRQRTEEMTKIMGEMVTRMQIEPDEIPVSEVDQFNAELDHFVNTGEVRPLPVKVTEEAQK